MVLAVSTYCPVGDSLRYVSQCASPSAMLSLVPALTSAIPSQYCASARLGSALTAASNCAFASGTLPAFQRMTPWLKICDALAPAGAPPAAPAGDAPTRSI